MAGKGLRGVCLLICLAVTSNGWTPEDFGVKVSDQLLLNPGAFINWNYGGALAFDGIHRLSEVFQLSNYTAILNKYLDQFLASPQYDGYKLLHGEKMPFGQAVGDTVGLFPIAYLNRVIAQSGQPGYDNKTDLLILKLVLEDYIMGWPERLPDGTFSRIMGWDGEPLQGATFLWADDQYMGVTLLSRVGAYLGDPLMVTDAARQIVQFERLRDPVDSLYRHGYNDADGHISCCKWGRANGWGIMGNLEVLEAFKAFPYLQNTDMHKYVLAMFQDRAAALLPWQSADGRWHQVINETSTFLETSCTAMFLVSMARGIEAGWLDAAKFRPAVLLAWEGLQKTVEADGTVTGVCMGTGIGTNVTFYQNRPTDYLKSAPGVGMLVSAASFVQTLID